MEDKRDLHLVVDAGTAVALRDAAARLGYVTQSGSMAGRGNLSHLFRELTSGHVDPHELDAVLAEQRAENTDKLIQMQENNT